MKHFSEKLVKRNYVKRILVIAIAAVTLLITISILIPTTLNKQIAEFKALEQTHEKQESVIDDIDEHRHFDKEYEIEEILHQLSPIEIGVKIVFAAVALLAFMLFAFYWITVAEWLYKMSVLHGLNRALWPMLGLVFNILIIPVLLIVLCNPNRTHSKLQG